MTTDLIREKLRTWARTFRRDAWLPTLQAEPTDDPTASKFGGVPYLTAAHPWPECGGCEEPLSLFAQLDLGTLPKGHPVVGESGFLQFFYCHHEDCESQGIWEHYAETQLVRLVPRDTAVDPGEPGHVRPTLRITAWTRIDDHPHFNDLEARGLESEYDFEAKTIRVRCEPAGVVSDWMAMDDFAVEQITETWPCHSDDKLGGWPYWVQSASPADCSTCRAPMPSVLQLTGDPLEIMFGDMGIGHVFQCPDHPDVLAFGWECS